MAAGTPRAEGGGRPVPTRGGAGPQPVVRIVVRALRGDPGRRVRDAAGRRNPVRIVVHALWGDPGRAARDAAGQRNPVRIVVHALWGDPDRRAPDAAGRRNPGTGANPALPTARGPVRGVVVAPMEVIAVPAPPAATLAPRVPRVTQAQVRSGVGGRRIARVGREGRVPPLAVAAERATIVAAPGIVRSTALAESPRGAAPDRASTVAGRPDRDALPVAPPWPPVPMRHDVRSARAEGTARIRGRRDVTRSASRCIRGWLPSRTSRPPRLIWIYGHCRERCVPSCAA